MRGPERSGPFPFLGAMKKARTPKKSNRRDLIEEQLKEENPKAMFADGFDDAIIGVSRRFGNDPLVAYSREKCINVLMKRDKMSEEDANEFFDFNVIGSYVGVGTPVFVDTEV
jgi:hypothetical protein